MKTNCYVGQMRRFGECSSELGSPAVFQPGKYIDVCKVNGAYRVDVDCWTWMWDCGLIDGEFDTDAWESHMLHLDQADDVSARAFWRDAFRTARALVNGMEVQLGPVPPFTIESYVAAIRATQVIKIGLPGGMVGEAEIAEALGCSIEDVRARAEREGWAYWLETEPGQPMVFVEPKKSH